MNWVVPGSNGRPPALRQQVAKVSPLAEVVAHGGQVRVLDARARPWETPPHAASPGSWCSASRTRGRANPDTWRRMPHNAMDPVRHKLSGQQRSRRRFEERLVARSPWLVDVWGRLIARLSPRSRVRQLLLVRAVHMGLAAYGRGDLELGLLAHHPSCEYHGPPDQGGWGRSSCREPPGAIRAIASLTPSGAAPGTHIGSCPKR
jgi:hypothetical protein